MGEQAVKRRTNGQFVKGNDEGQKFKPGQSGNPNGRNGSIADLFKELADVEDDNGKTSKEKIVKKISKRAEKG